MSLVKLRLKEHDMNNVDFICGMISHKRIKVEDTWNVSSNFKNNIELFLKEGGIYAKGPNEVLVCMPEEFGYVGKDTIKSTDMANLMADVMLKMTSYPSYSPRTIGEANLLQDTVGDMLPYAELAKFDKELA